MEPVTRESYSRMPVENKLDVLYDSIADINKCSCYTRDNLAMLEKKVNGKRKLDTSVSAFFGFIGGFAALISEKLFK